MYARFIDRPLATALLALGLVVFGIAAFFLLPVAALPDTDYPGISVEAHLPGASADTMAATVAAPLERQLSAVRGVRSMTSTSDRGSATITLEFETSTNLDAATIEVQSALTQAASELPAELPNPPIYYRDNPSDYSILGVALVSDTLPLIKVDSYAETIVVRRASMIPGVRRAIDWARQRAAVRVELNPASLAARGLSLEDVRAAIRDASVDQPKGGFDSGRRTAILSANDQLFDAESFGRVVIAWRKGAAVRLSDVARVYDGSEDEDSIGTFNGHKAIEFGYRRVPGANIVAAVDAIREQLPAMEATLPPGVTIHVALDRSISIRAAIHDVELALVVATLLVVLVIFIFLRSARATLIPSIVIPVSLVATFIVMYLCGYSLDNLSLMALTIAVGFVVDDAIVVIENIARHIEAGEDPLTAARKGVEQVGFTIISITLSLIAVFIPVLLMRGVVGRLFREFGVTLSVAILISAVISLVLTPMMCARLLHQQAPQVRQGGAARLAEAFVDGLTRLYARSLAWALRHGGWVLLSFAVSLVLAGWLYVVAPKGFFPPQDTGRIQGKLVTSPDNSAKANAALATRIGDIIRADRDVASTLTNKDGIYVTLVPTERRSAPLGAILDRLRQATSNLPGVQFYLKQQGEITLGGFSGNHAEYQYTLTDANADELNQWAPKLEHALADIPGLRDFAADQRDFGQEVRVEIDRDLAARLGISVGAIDQTLYDAFGRRRVREVFSDAAQYYVLMEVDPAFRLDERALESLYAKSADGSLVPIGAVAKAHLIRSPLSVRHEGQLPAVSMSFNLEPGISLGAAVERIHAVEQRIGKPVALQSAFAGSAGEFERSLASQPWLIAAAVLIVYIVLGILYESLLHPLTILSTLPSAGIGALLLLRVLGYDLSVIAMIGILLLIGIVKKNAIMMVDFAIQAERGGTSPIQAIRTACLIRFRPIMMTTLAALVGALPLALGSGTGFELRRPLGIAIVGGLMLSQVLTLYTTPVIYLAVGQFGRRIHAWWAGVRLQRARIPAEACRPAQKGRVGMARLDRSTAPAKSTGAPPA